MPQEIELALLTCLVDRNYLPKHIPVSCHARYLSPLYSGQILPLRRQLVVNRSPRSSPPMSSPAPGPIIRSTTRHTHAPSPSDKAAISPPAPPPARARARGQPVPRRIRPPPPKPPPPKPPPPNPARQATPTVTPTAKRSEMDRNVNLLVAKAVVLSVLATSLVAFMLFCCYSCNKKRKYGANSQRDERPLLSLRLSDYSGNYNKHINLLCQDLIITETIYLQKKD